MEFYAGMLDSGLERAFWANAAARQRLGIQIQLTWQHWAWSHGALKDELSAAFGPDYLDWDEGGRSGPAPHWAIGLFDTRDNWPAPGYSSPLTTREISSQSIHKMPMILADCDVIATFARLLVSAS